MAIEHLKSGAITNADATPVVFNNARVTRLPAHVATGTVEVSASASATSTYRLCRVPSNAVVNAVIVDCDAQGGSGALDIGLYATARDGGAVVDADLFASALAVATALSSSNVTHESGVYDIADIGKPLWEVLGLTADPMVDYDVAATITTAVGTGVATFSLRVEYGQ